MHPILKNIAAGIAGLIVGSIVNMALIMVSGSIVPPPEGADLTTAEGLQLGMAMMEPRHFIFPFLAHALGTLAGAYLAARIAARRKMGMALVIGIFFLAGGSASVYMLPSPMWFTALDLVLAYLPMAYIGGKLAVRYPRQQLT